MTYGPSLEILEVAYEVSPGGVRTFEIYDKSEIEPVQIPIFETESLTEAVEFCYFCHQCTVCCWLHISCDTS